jgi:hypothetical protein
VAAALAVGACSQPVTAVAPTPTEGLAIINILGAVRDAVNRPLVGASVEIQNQSRTVATLVTDSMGAYRWTGKLFGAATFRAAMDGYVSSIETLTPDPHVSINGPVFELDLAAPSAGIDTGDYELSFTADSNCTGLPESVRSRTYSATVSRASANLYPVGVANTQSWLAGPGGFSIGASGGTLGILDDTAPEFIEHIAPFTYLEVAIGGFFAAETPRVSTMSFPAGIVYCELNAAPAGFFCQTVPRDRVISLVVCYGNGRITLTRK